jgi:hypothetical protein
MQHQLPAHHYECSGHECHIQLDLIEKYTVMDRTLTKETEVLGETPASVPLCFPKIHALSAQGLRPVLCDEELVSNRLSCNMTT